MLESSRLDFIPLIESDRKSINRVMSLLWKIVGLSHLKRTITFEALILKKKKKQLGCLLFNTKGAVSEPKESKVNNENSALPTYIQFKKSCFLSTRESKCLTLFKCLT